MWLLGQSGSGQAWLAVLILFFALVVPAVIMRIIAGVSGWRTLARRYPPQPHGPGRGGSFGSIRFQALGGYNNCIIWKADETYLHLRVWPVIGVFHRAMSVPWEAIQIQPGRLGMAQVEIDGVTWGLPKAMLRDEVILRQQLGGEA
jgi:hypothetical protein